LLEGFSTASDSDQIIQSSRKPPLASDKIRGYPNGYIGRSRDEHDSRGKVRYLTEAGVRMSA
jgi:hypothetical protein